jgi:hypothetical protein
MNINGSTARLVLFAPARKKWGTAKTLKPGTVILHSRADAVAPLAFSEVLARPRGATFIVIVRWPTQSRWPVKRQRSFRRMAQGGHDVGDTMHPKCTV